MIRRAVVLLALSACTTQPPASPVTFHPDPDGLEVRPSGLRVNFGRAPAGVIAVLDRELGSHQELSLTGCSVEVAQQLRWGDLVLSFSADRFVGWRQGAEGAGNTCA